MDPQDKKIELDILERLEILPSCLTDIVTKGFLDVTAFELAETHGLTSLQTTLLKNEVALVLMLFTRRSELAAKLQESLEVDGGLSAQLAEKIDDDLFHIYEEEELILTAVDEKMQTAVEKVPPTESLGTLQPVRTMSDDVKRAQQLAPIYVEPEASQAGNETPVEVASENSEETSIDTPKEPIEAAAEEPVEETVIEATSQADTLSKRPSLATLPQYQKPEADNPDAPQ